MRPQRRSMGSVGFSWESLLHTDAPRGCSLKAGLFTTYDRADERLLAEHLLPLFLKLNHEPDGEGTERQHFLLELDRRLKQLHGHLVVVSSPVREDPADSEEGKSDAYGWIWRTVHHLTVGSRRKAIQHAKLWLIHWSAADVDGAEYLELVVSSANLTLTAFKGQLQAAWRTCIKLQLQRSEARLARWGVLPHFLRELAVSAGEETWLSPFIELLARAECPEGVRFVASVPGTHSHQVLRRTPWGAAGLREIAPAGRGTVSVSILSPFIGSWNADALSRWCTPFEGSPVRLELVWIDENHPWARAERWLLPKATLKTLTSMGATLLHLRHKPDDYEGTDLFHENHRPTDDRWSHAKVYSFKRGSSRRLLVTSANFSTAAWGREGGSGELTIENFELGVCIEQAAWPFEELEPFDDVKQAATISQLPNRGTTLITWARARWNGRIVDVDCRCEANGELRGEIGSNSERIPIINWMIGVDGHLRSAQVQWTDTKQAPLWVELTCEQETMRVAIFDDRPPTEREDTTPPEVDENIIQTIRDELLFEQYGGHIAVDIEDGKLTEESEEATGEEPREGGAGRSDSYAIPAFVFARQHFRVIDNWVDRVRCAAKRGTAEFERHVLRRDGALLIEAFKRQEERGAKKDPSGGIGARLAAEELSLRLKHFPEA